MLFSMMLFATGLVIAADGGAAVVRSTAPVEVGQVLTVKRLEPVSGAPGRAPFFRWSRTGEVRVAAVRSDGVAEVALISGKAARGDRVSD
jgi:hypothetical protein